MHFLIPKIHLQTNWISDMHVESKSRARSWKVSSLFGGRNRANLITDKPFGWISARCSMHFNENFHIDKWQTPISCIVLFLLLCFTHKTCSLFVRYNLFNFRKCTITSDYDWIDVEKSFFFRQPTTSSAVDDNEDMTVISFKKLLRYSEVERERERKEKKKYAQRKIKIQRKKYGCKQNILTTIEQNKNNQLIGWAVKWMVEF